MYLQKNVLHMCMLLMHTAVIYCDSNMSCIIYTSGMTCKTDNLYKVPNHNLLHQVISLSAKCLLGECFVCLLWLCLGLKILIAFIDSL